jgi:hypothetical protein
METLAFIEHSSSDLAAWAAGHFGGVDLGHVARNRRALVIAEAYARRPGASILSIRTWVQTPCSSSTEQPFVAPRARLAWSS